MNIKPIVLIVLLCVLLSGSCQRDDICPETTQTTPRLVIEFFDSENPAQPKSVRQLNIIAEGETEYYFESSVTQSTVTIPLRTNQNFTNYEFRMNSDEEEDSDVIPNSDQLEFSYGIQQEYVSRACGYKVEFLDFDAFLVNEEGDGNWIDGIEVQQPNDIVDEATTHLYIFH